MSVDLSLLAGTPAMSNNAKDAHEDVSGWRGLCGTGSLWHIMLYACANTLWLRAHAQYSCVWRELLNRCLVCTLQHANKSTWLSKASVHNLITKSYSIHHYDSDDTSSYGS